MSFLVQWYICCQTQKVHPHIRDIFFPSRTRKVLSMMPRCSSRANILRELNPSYHVTSPSSFRYCCFILGVEKQPLCTVHLSRMFVLFLVFYWGGGEGYTKVWSWGGGLNLHHPLIKPRLTVPSYSTPVQDKTKSFSCSLTLMQ